MQDRKLFESYLIRHSWGQADAWLEAELCFMRSKFTRQRIVYHTFGVLMSLVLAFFTWVVLFPSADEKELKAFPLATVCHNLFTMLCETVPGGKPVVIIGLLLIPFLVSAILAAVFFVIKPKKYVEGDKKRATPEEVEKKISQLGSVYYKYSQPYVILLYFLIAGVFSGGVMVLSSVPGGLNPFEYIFVGIICDVVYFLAFAGCAWLFNWFYDRFGVKYYPEQDWKATVREVIETRQPKSGSSSSYSSSRSDSGKKSLYYEKKFNEYYAQYMGLDYETDEERAKRIVREVEDDLSGSGYGDY